MPEDSRFKVNVKSSIFCMSSRSLQVNKNTGDLFVSGFDDCLCNISVESYWSSLTNILRYLQKLSFSERLKIRSPTSIMISDIYFFIKLQYDLNPEEEIVFSNGNTDQYNLLQHVFPRLKFDKEFREKRISRRDDLSYLTREDQDEYILKNRLSYDEIPINYIPMKIQLGLCCINSELRSRGIYTSRKPTLKTIREKGIEYLQEQSLLNCEDLYTHIQWNAEHGIRVFRISSELFPHASNPQVVNYNLDFAKPLLKKIGELARWHKQRLTFHPGQFDVLGTADEKVFNDTLRDLDYHAEVLDLMGMDQDSIMVVHGGGTYGDKPTTIKRWIKNFRRLPKRVRRRLVIENCERCYSIEDCLEISKKINIPVVFDTHHYNCYNQQVQQCKRPEEYIPEILETWRKRNIKPKFHISEQGEGRIGCHSDYVESIPEYLLEIPEKYGADIDIMIEAKAKEKAVFQLYKSYWDRLIK